MKYVFGIDVGGTSVKIGFLNEQGELLDRFSVLTDTSNHGDNILFDIANAIKAFIKEKNINETDILGFGFGLPGPVHNDFVVRCPNLGWDSVFMPEAFSAAYGKSVNVKATNDATAAAVGEYWQQEMNDDMVFFTLGTGVGGGIVINQKGVDGVHGAGAELGHIRVEHKHPIACTCGLDGCLETVASIRGVVGITRRLMKENKLETTLYDSDKLNPKVIFDAAKNNDPLALEVVEEVADYMGLACATIAVTVDPKIFLIGGGISNAGSILTTAIQKHYLKYAHFGVKDARFELAKLGNDAGMYGAAYLIISDNQ